MQYKQVTITTTHSDIDLITATLSPLCSGFIIDDPQDIVDFAAEKSTKWDYIDESLFGAADRPVTVTLYLEADDTATLAQVQQAMAEGGYAISIAVDGVQSEDWENNWKQYYKPFSVGDRLLIRPSWEPIVNPENRTVLTIDPASSFGTGSHATTRLCLDAIDRLDCTGKTVLDAGCGSGILMTAMLLLGATQAFGCDIEQNAVNTTAENILKNHIVPERFSVHCGDFLSNQALFDTLSAQGYDIICANIVSDVLKAMCPHLLSWLNPGGTLLISGIIAERTEEVVAHYTQAGAQIAQVTTVDGWSMVKMAK